jgi:hypothetical protein
MVANQQLGSYGIIPAEELIKTSYRSLFKKYRADVPRIMRCRSEITLAEQSMGFVRKIADFTPDKATIGTSLLALDFYEHAFRTYNYWNNYIGELGKNITIEPIGGRAEMEQIGREAYWFLGEQYIESLLGCLPIPFSQASMTFEQALHCYELSEIKPRYRDEDFKLIRDSLKEAMDSGREFQLPDCIL